MDIPCATDLPEDSYDAVFMPVLKAREAELTRELMQQAHSCDSRLWLSGDVRR